jgi:uncharacterized beta-barrel protein YwiB (DUF1934 family)
LPFKFLGWAIGVSFRRGEVEMKLKQLQRKINQEKYDVKGIEVVLEVEGQEVHLANVELCLEEKKIRLQGGAPIEKK